MEKIGGGDVGSGMIIIDRLSQGSSLEPQNTENESNVFLTSPKDGT